MNPSISHAVNVHPLPQMMIPTVVLRERLTPARRDGLSIRYCVDGTGRVTVVGKNRSPRIEELGLPVRDYLEPKRRPDLHLPTVHGFEG